MFACESSDWGKIEFVTEYLNVLTREPLADYIAFILPLERADRLVYCKAVKQTVAPRAA
jgi:hypothetical protein